MLRYGILGVAGLQAAVLLFMVVLYATGSGGGGLSGGPEMGLVFLVLLPLVLLVGSVALFWFTRSRILRALAALAIVAPTLAILYRRVDEGIMQSTLREDASGRGYFADPLAKDLAASVVQGDAAKVAALSQRVDINQFGTMHETFLRLAMEQTGDHAGVVAALLQAGADPNQDGAWPGDGGWPVRHAVETGDMSLLKLLLDAGADPNQTDILGQPAFFEALARPDLLGMLLPHGVRLTAQDANGWTAPMVAVRAGQWSSVDEMLAAGADAGFVAGNGLNLAGVVEELRRQKTTAGEPVPPELLALEARLPKPPGGLR